MAAPPAGGPGLSQNPRTPCLVLFGCVGCAQPQLLPHISPAPPCFLFPARAALPQRLWQGATGVPTLCPLFPLRWQARLFLQALAGQPANSVTNAAH